MSRAVASHHCGLGSIHVPSVTRRLSFSLVLFFAPWVFLLVLRSPPSAKNQHFEFQSNLETVDKKSQPVDFLMLNFFNPIIIVVVVIFVCPILRICYLFTCTAVSILQILEILRRLFSSLLVLRFG